MGRKPGGSFFPFLSKYFSEWYVLKMEVGLGHPFFHASESKEKGGRATAIPVLAQGGENQEEWKRAVVSLIKLFGRPELLTRMGNLRFAPVSVKKEGDDGGRKQEGDDDVQEIEDDPDRLLREMFAEVAVVYCGSDGRTAEPENAARARTAVFATVRQSLVANHPYIPAGVCTGDVYALVRSALRVNGQVPEARDLNRYQTVVNFTHQQGESPAAFAARFAQVRAQNETIVASPVCVNIMMELLVQAVEACATWSIAAGHMRGAISKNVGQRADMDDLLVLFSRHTSKYNPPDEPDKRLVGRWAQNKMPKRACFGHKEGYCNFGANCQFSHDGPVLKGYCGCCGVKGHSWVDCDKTPGKHKKGGAGGAGGSSKQTTGRPEVEPKPAMDVAPVFDATMVRTLQSLAQVFQGLRPGEGTVAGTETLAANSAKAAPVLAPWGVEGNTLADVAAGVRPE